jgi:hypothetical protein
VDQNKACKTKKPKKKARVKKGSLKPQHSTSKSVPGGGNALGTGVEIIGCRQYFQIVDDARRGGNGSSSSSGNDSDCLRTVIVLLMLYQPQDKISSNRTAGIIARTAIAAPSQSVKVAIRAVAVDVTTCPDALIVHGIKRAFLPSVLVIAPVYCKNDTSPTSTSRQNSDPRTKEVSSDLIPHFDFGGDEGGIASAIEAVIKR